MLEILLNFLLGMIFPMIIWRYFVLKFSRQSQCLFWLLSGIGLQATQSARLPRLKFLSYLDKESKEIILMGDTNYDLSSGSSDSNSRYIQNLYQLLSTSSTLIDHIATTSIDNILESGVHRVSLSDHYMVFCKHKLNIVVGGGHKLVITRNMKHCNEESFLADISHFCWEELVYRTDDTNTMVNDWSSMFFAVIEKHAPIREMRVSDKNSPWVNSELKYLMKSRDKLKKAAVKHKSPAMMSCYKKARNTVKNLNVSLKKHTVSIRLLSIKVT